MDAESPRQWLPSLQVNYHMMRRKYYYKVSQRG